MADRADMASELARAEARLAQLDCEREDLLSRLSVLRAEFSSRPAAPIITVESPPPSTAPAPATQAERVSLFRALFRGAHGRVPAQVGERALREVRIFAALRERVEA